MEILAWGQTDPGVIRDTNEDSYLIRADLGLFAVADGMGGGHAGASASRVALDAVASYLYTHREVLEVDVQDVQPIDALPPLVDGAFQAASLRVFNQASAVPRPVGQLLASTVSMLVLTGSRGVVAHVGDSRIYLLRDREIYLISEDHNHLQVLIKNGLDPILAARVPNARALTRVVGAQARVEVDTLSFVPLPEDIFFLCTDGLYGLVSREEIGALLRSDDLAEVPDRFISLARERGAPDNVTAMVVQVRTSDGQSARTTRLQEETRLEMTTLANLELFGNLDYLDILELLGRFQELHVPAGETLFVEGSTGSELYVIVQGRVELRAAGRLLRILGRGAHFGEFALIDQRPRSATVTTLEPTHLLLLSLDQFNRLKREDPARALGFYEVIARRLSLNLREADQLLLKK